MSEPPVSEPNPSPTPPGRRRRRRATAPTGAPPPAVAAAKPAVAAAKPAVESPEPASGASNADATPIPGGRPRPPADRPRRRRPSRDQGEHGLGDIVGAGPTQVSVSRALRARDVNRPTPADLAAAEQEVVIVRRNWQPDRPAR